MSSPGYVPSLPRRHPRRGSAALALRLPLPPLVRLLARRRREAVYVVAIPHAADLPPT